MDELDFIQNELKTLNEAAAETNVSPVKQIKDIFNVDLINLKSDNPTWNDLYSKAKGKRQETLYRIVINDVVRKSDNEILADKQSKTYLKLDGETQTGKIFKKINKVDSKNISGVTSEDEASLFTPENCDIVISAVNNNRDLKVGKVSKEVFPESTEDWRSEIRKLYWHVLASGESIHSENDNITSKEESFYKKDQTDLMMGQICDNVKNPLVGEITWIFLKTGYDLNNEGIPFQPSSKCLRIINDLLVDSEISERTILQKRSFESLAIYNTSLYDNDLEEIEYIFRTFRKYADQSPIKFEKFKRVEPIDFALNLVLKPAKEGEDKFLKTINDIQSEPELDIEITEDSFKFPWGVESVCKDHKVRTATEISVLLEKLTGNKEFSKEEEHGHQNFYLQIVAQGSYNPTKVLTSEPVDYSNSDNIKVNFKAFEVHEDEYLRLVRCSEEDKDNTSNRNFIGDIKKLVNDKQLVKSLFDDDSKQNNTFKHNAILTVEITLKEVDNGFQAKDVKINLEEESTNTNNSNTENQEEVTFTNDEFENEHEPKQESKIEISSNVSQDKYFNEIDPTSLGGVLDGDMIRGVTLKSGDIITGADGNKYIATKKTLPSDNKWDIKAGTNVMRLKPELIKELSDLGFGVIPYIKNGLK